MRPTDQKERDKQHIRSLQQPRLIADFRLCNVAIAEMERAELLGAICWLLKGQLAKEPPKRKQQSGRIYLRQISARA